MHRLPELSGEHRMVAQDSYIVASFDATALL